MVIWQDVNGGLHDDMGGEAILLQSWPQGMVKLTQTEVDAILSAQPAIPNSEGFAQAIKSAMGGILAANAAAIAYPLFFGAVQGCAWDDVRAMLIDAKLKSVITASQYKAIKSAAAQFNIPVTL